MGTGRGRGKRNGIRLSLTKTMTDCVKILLIGNDPRDAALAGQIAEESRSLRPTFTFCCAAGLPAGFDRLAESDIDVVLLNLPASDHEDLSVLTELLRRAPKAPIVVLTDIADEATALLAVREGAQDYLLREGLDARLLKQAVRYAIERKKMQEDLRQVNIHLSKALSDLKRTQQQVLKHERLSALGHMAGRIANDFNNVLTPILGYTDILLADAKAFDNKQETIMILKNLRAAADRGCEVVRRLAEFCGPSDAADHAPLDLRNLVEDVVAQTAQKWKGEMFAGDTAIKIKTEIGDVPPVSGIQYQLREALANLVSNAVEAMPNGGVLTITARAHESGEAVELRISDTGAGMTDEARQRCFEPFFTTKSGHGAGLGLAIAHSIVRRHGGSVDIQSAPLKGTTVIVQLPVAQSPPVKKKPEAPPPSPKRSAKPIRILLIDDEPAVREIVAWFLTLDGYVVEEAANGKDGLDKFRLSAFDLVITDQAMPRMTGDQVAKAIKESHPETPVILLTGFGSIMKADGGRHADIDMIVSKPVTREGLVGAIAALTTMTRMALT